MNIEEMMLKYEGLKQQFAERVSGMVLEYEDRIAELRTQYTVAVNRIAELESRANEKEQEPIAFGAPDED